MAEKFRLDRSNWLDAALDALYEAGEAGVKVEPLARRLGVTKGSFYHHFRDRDELLLAMIDRWRAIQESHLDGFARFKDEPAAVRVERVIAFTQAKDSRHDVGMRAWALHHAAAGRALQAIDKRRLQYLEDLFAELDFAEDAAKLRARLLYFYQVGEYTLSVRDREALRERLKQLRFDLLTGQTTPKKPEAGAAVVVLPCSDLEATLRFFSEQLGFRVDAIFPADHPSVVEISGYGLHIRLQRGADGAPGVLRLVCNDPDAVAAKELTAPNGTRIELVDTDPPLTLPPLQSSFVLNKIGSNAKWQVGRAGMLYRDLIPDRQGGRFIASHIRIPDGGPVPDYVHFHKIHFQMIYCYKGWVRVVYEDQGAPFVMQAGDCVLQPPKIRHRVLECSPGLEVVEVGCPAEHETCADHDLTLPTNTVQKDRNFSGQQFVHHVASEAPWRPWHLPGFDYRDIGIAAATQGIATVHVVRPTGGSPLEIRHDREFCFTFVLQGTFVAQFDGHTPQQLAAGDSFVLPSEQRYELAECSDDLELLQVGLP